MTNTWINTEDQKPEPDTGELLQLWWASGIVEGYFDTGLFKDGSFWIPAIVPYGLGFHDEGREYKKLIHPTRWRYKMMANKWISVNEKLPAKDTPRDSWIIAYSAADGAFPARFRDGRVPYFENLLEIDYEGDPAYVFVATDGSPGIYNVIYWMQVQDPYD